MYIMPFWSYRPVDNTCVIKNWLTGETILSMLWLIDLLEEIYNNGEVPKSTAETHVFVQTVLRLNLLFDSKASCDTWLHKVEDQWLNAVPTIDQIGLTNRCPYTCQMCPRTVAMDRSVGNMSLELFELIFKCSLVVG